MIVTGILKEICIYIQMCARKEKWRKRNKHNNTTISNHFDFDLVTVGNGTYGELKVLLHNRNYRLKIGDYCSIAPDVTFIPASDHRMDLLSTYPFKRRIFDPDYDEAVSKGDIEIGNDVWIGASAIILSGVHVGQGAVIASGAVVANDIPPYAVAGGVPAKVIRYRFDTDVVERLINIDYSSIDYNFIRKNMDKLYTKISSGNNLSWLPFINEG